MALHLGEMMQKPAVVGLALSLAIGLCPALTAIADEAASPAKPATSEPRPADSAKSEFVVPDKVDPSRGLPDDAATASTPPATPASASTDAADAAKSDAAKSDAAKSDAAMPDAAKSDAPMPDDIAAAMRTKPQDKDIYKVAMTPAPPAVAAAIKARYDAYQRLNLTAKSFDDLDSVACKELRERSQQMKTAIYNSDKVKNKTDKEKFEAYAGLFQFFNMMKPRSATVTGIKVSGDVAIVSVVTHDMGALPEALVKGMTGMVTGMANGMAQGVSSMVGAKKPAPIKAPVMKPSTFTMEGKIYMQKEDGQWNFAGEDYKQVFSAEEKKQQAAAKVSSDWCAEAVSMPLSQKPVTGMLHGSKFVMRNAEYLNGLLKLRSGTEFFPDLAIEIFIFGINNDRPDGQTIIMQKGDKKDGKSCHVHMEWKKPGAKFNESKTYFDMDKLGLKLQFGQRNGNKLPGFINLRLPDALKSNIQGYFWADIK